MSSVSAPAPLTEDQIRFLDEEGYLVLEPFMDQGVLQAAVDEISGEIDRRAEELVRKGSLSRSYSEYDFEHRLAMITRETDALYKGIMAGNLTGPGIFGMLTQKNLLDVAEQLCGPEVIASSAYRLRPKVPGHQWGEVPWHQDSAYFEPYCDRFRIIICWIPLVDATEDRGCMWVLPRAHRNGVVRHVGTPGAGYLKINSQDLPQGKPVCCPVRKGGALIMTNITPHASFENRSDVVRWSMDLRYQGAAAPTNARQTTKQGSERADDAAPIACFPPERDFLVRSRMHDDDVIRTSDAFRRLRSEHAVSDMTDRWSVRGNEPVEQKA